MAFGRRGGDWGRDLAPTSLPAVEVLAGPEPPWHDLDCELTHPAGGAAALVEAPQRPSIALDASEERPQGVLSPSAGVLAGTRIPDGPLSFCGR